MIGQASTALAHSTRAVCLTALLAVAGCEAVGDREPDIESGVPAWRSDRGASAASSRPAAKPAAAQRVEYTVSEPESAQLAAVAHRDALLASDVAPLPTDEVGYYTDTQEARLIQVLRGTDMKAERAGNNFEFLLDGAFATNSSQLLESAKKKLSIVAGVLAEYDRTRVSIFGYTDDVGPGDYNQKLSVRRASAVARFLEENGVDPRRFFIVGFGELQPIADNAIAAGRARNRRVELIVEPLTPPSAPANAENPAEAG